MKRVLLFLFCFIIVTQFTYGQSMNIDVLRKEYFKVKSDSVSCSKLYQKIIKDKSTDNTILCYKGAISAAMADYIKNKQEKIKLFTTGKKLIEESISKDTNNIEFRFLRFTIQTNCPKALGYNKQIASDKKKIVDNYSTNKNSVLQHTMFDYLYHSSYLTEEDKNKIAH